MGPFLTPLTVPDPLGKLFAWTVHRPRGAPTNRLDDRWNQRLYAMERSPRFQKLAPGHTLLTYWPVRQCAAWRVEFLRDCKGVAVSSQQTPILTFELER